MASCLRASPSVRHTEGRDALKEHLTVSGPCSHACDGVADDGSRWRCPALTHGFNAVTQNGSAASELAPMRILHHGLGLWPAAYKHVARSFVHRPAAPLGLVIPDTPCIMQSCSKPSKDKPIRVALRAILDCFCARRRSPDGGSGRRNGFAGSNKETEVQENG
jgi:hypothetical protein